MDYVSVGAIGNIGGTPMPRYLWSGTGVGYDGGCVVVI